MQRTLRSLYRRWVQRRGARQRRLARAAAARHRRVIFEPLEIRSLLATLMPTGTTADVIYTLPATADSVFLEDDGTSGNGMLQLRSGSGTFDTTVFANPTGSLTINRGNAADSITINNLPSSEFNAGLTIGSAGAEFSSVTFASALTLAPDKNLSVNATGTISLPNTASKVAVSGLGAIALTTARDFKMVGASHLTSVNGDITILANQQATPTPGNFVGIYVDQGDIQTNGTGSIILSGRGGDDPSTSQHYGVWLRHFAFVAAGITRGPANVTVTGIGGNASDDSAGVRLGVTIGDGTVVESVKGDVTITGVATATSGSLEDGIRSISGTLQDSGGASDAVTLMGTPGVSTGGTAGMGLRLDGGQATAPRVNLISDRMSVGTSTSLYSLNGAGPLGVVSFRPKTIGTAIDVGSTTDTATGTLELSSADLGAVRSQTINIGDANTGAITVSAPITTSYTVNLIAGSKSNITFSGNGSLTSQSGNVSLTTDPSGSGAIVAGAAVVHVTAANVSITAGAGGIGASGSPLTFSATSINSTTGGNGSQFLSASNSATIDSTGLSAGTGTIELDGGTFTLGGSGRIDDKTNIKANGATLDAGANGEAIGGLNLTSGSTLALAINGQSAGSQYGQLITSGNVNLANTTLSLSGTYTPLLGDAFVLLRNDGPGAITGTFNGLPEGQQFITPGSSFTGLFQISYRGGDGNDVVITPASGARAVIDGTANDDTWLVQKNGANVNVTLNGSTVFSQLAGSFGSLTINGLAGNDTATIDLSAGNVIPTGGITFNGGDPTAAPGDKLVILGGSQGTVTYNSTNSHDGSIVMSNFGTVNYTGLEPITNSGSATDVVFNLPSTASRAVLEDDGTTNNGLLQLRSSNGTFETTLFANPSATLTINRGNSADTLVVNALPDLTATVKLGASGAALASMTVAGALTLGAAKNLTAYATTQSFAAAAVLGISGGGTIVLTADTIDFDPAATISAGNSTVTIAPLSPGRAVTLGSKATGQMSLTDAELDRINAGTLRIGDSVFGGPITVSAPINVANNTTPIPTLHLLSHGAVINNCTTSPAITVTNLAIEGFSGSGTTTALTTQASNLAASYVGGYDLNISNTGDLTVTNVDALSGGTGATGGGMSLTTTGNLNINAFTGSNPGPTQITAAGVDKLLTINSTFSGLGDATITADKMAINASVNFGSSAKVTLQPYTSATAVKLGSTTDAAGHTLELSSAELANIVFANLQVGNTNCGTITVGDVTRTGNLSLVTGGEIDVNGTINTGGGNLTLAPGSDYWAIFGGSGVDANVGAGALGFANGSTLLFPIGDTGAGVVGYPQLNVAGSINLTGAALSAGVLNLSYTPKVGDSFLLINNDGSDPITGTFSGLPEGAVFQAGLFRPVICQITYHGGDGNDVVMTVIGSSPVLQGTPGDDSWLVERNNDDIDITLNGNLIGSLPYVSLTSLAINGLAGNDTLTVDLSAGNAIPSGGLFFNGGMPTTSPGDKLIITGNSQGTVTYNYTNSHDGSIVMSNYGRVNYTGLEPIVNSGSATDVIFNLPTGPNTVTLGDDGTSGNGLSRISASTIETTDFANPSGTLTINRGNSADAITFNALPDFSGGLTIASPGAEVSTVTFAGSLILAPDKNLSVSATGTIGLSKSASHIALSGTGAASLVTARDIGLGPGASITSIDGPITLSANQQATPTVGDFAGITLSDAQIQATGAGAVTLSGTGGSGLVGQCGIVASGLSTITGGTTGALRVTGKGGSSGGNNYGVEVYNSKLTSTGADVIVVGYGGTSGIVSAPQYGVMVYRGAKITAGGTGRVSVTGTGGSSDGQDYGVLVGSATITSGGGDVTVTGFGGNGSANESGVVVQGTISVGGSGVLTVNGTGGQGTSSDPDTGSIGVDVSYGLIISTGGAAVAVNGIGGGLTNSASGGNYGVRVTSNGSIWGGASGFSGSLRVSGQGGKGSGGSNDGLVVEGAMVAGTDLMASASAGEASVGSDFIIAATANITASNDGLLTLVADSISIDAASSVYCGSGTATIKPVTPGTKIHLGQSDSAGVMGLTDAELDRVIAGALDIGDPSCASIAVNADITRASLTNITLTSGGAISFSTGAITTDGGNLTLAPGSAGASFPHAGVDVDLGAGGKLSFATGTNLVMAITGPTADTQHDQLNVVGNIDLTGVNLVLAGTQAHAVGNQLMLVNNDGTDSVAGTFHNLSDGLLVIPSGVQAGIYAVSYGAGDGNDVLLTAINAQPMFTGGPDESATDEDAAWSIARWAKNISAGLSPDEASQKLQFVVTTDVLSSTSNKPLFSAGPVIDADTGNLTFTPVPNVVGIARVTVKLMDDGGTVGGGIDTSDQQAFTIQIMKAHVWHNAVKAQDVNGDNEIAPNDLTVLISFLNGYGATDVPKDGRGGGPYCDVDGDGVVAPKDLSRVIIYLNAFGAGEGEGTETSNVQVPPVASDLSVTDALFALLAADTASQGKRRL